MVYELKLLIAASIVAMFTALAVRPAFRELLPGKQYFTPWKIVGLSIAVSFLSQMTWIFFVGVAATALIAYKMLGGDYKAKIAAFLMLTLLFPPVSQSLSGVADINHLFILNPVYTLSLVLLGPASIQLLLRKRVERGNPFRAVDAFLIAYKVLELVLMMRSISGTAAVRIVFEGATTVLFPYYVITRGLRSVDDIKFVATFMMIGFAFLAGIGAAEELMTRGMYSPLSYIYGVKWQLTHTLMRGGMLRVQATTPEPIALAILMIAGLGLWTWLAGSGWKRPRSLVVYGLLLATLAFTWSRGPWIGAVVLAVNVLALRFLSSRVYLVGLAVVLCAAVIGKVTGADQGVYDMLKSIFGSSDSDFATIEYRRQIMDASIALMQQSPLFGVPNYAAYLQEFRQGEGIIDIVNTYLIIGLNAGVVGLALYLMPQLIVFFKLISRLILNNEDRTRDLFVRAFASTLLALMFTLFTTSTIGVIPYILLTWVALPLVYVQYRGHVADPASALPRRLVPVFDHSGH